MAMAKEVMGGGFSAVAAQALGGQYVALTAAGSSLATATPVTASRVVVASADGTKGISLPSASVGDEIWIFNNSGSTCPVYPESASVAIAVPGTGLGTAGSAYSQTTYAACLYKKITSTQWIVIKSA